MAMIFPGMDPYLEHPDLWPGVHSRLVVYLADQLQPMLGPRYIAAVEERVYLEGPDRDIIPDVWLKRQPLSSGGTALAEAPADGCEVLIVPDLEIHETYVAILDRATNQRIVTVIEVVSPTNKHSGPGRDSYLSKQHEVRYSETHLVEIDLLRDGHSVVAAPPHRLQRLGHYDYLACVERAGQRGRFEIYRRSLRDPLPTVSIPLAGDDPDIPLKLQDAIEKVYNAGSYRDRIRYSKPCYPPLSEELQNWATARIAAASTP
ncbi:MAG: DUF4058 family protein [Pirellulales bacterium]